jgi:16S rRNA processing protein RimM
MQKEDMYFLGKIIRPKGNKGEVKAYLDVDRAEDYKSLDAVFIEKRRDLVPYFIERIHFEQQKANIKFQDVNSAEEAAELSGLLIYLPLSTLPERTGNKFYYHEVVGFSIIDRVSGDIGIIEKVVDLPNNPLFQVRYSNKDILIPVSDEFIITVDRKKRQIEMNLPEGLIDIYL